MADVFISYKREDRVWAERISKALGDAGISTWWDTSLVAGEHFNEAINRELKACRCVVVVWSQASHASRWVRSEASHGFDRDILVPARIDGVVLDVPFSNLQAAPIDGGDLSSLIRGVQFKLNSPISSSKKPKSRSSIGFVPSAIFYGLSAIAVLADAISGGQGYAGWNPISLFLDFPGAVLFAAVPCRIRWRDFLVGWRAVPMFLASVISVLAMFVMLTAMAESASATLGDGSVTNLYYSLAFFLMIPSSALLAAVFGWLATRP